MPIETHISTTVDLTRTVENLSDQERVEWLTALLESITEEGTIATLRSLVNDPKWNDQAPNP